MSTALAILFNALSSRPPRVIAHTDPSHQATSSPTAHLSEATLAALEAACKALDRNATPVVDSDTLPEIVKALHSEVVSRLAVALHPDQNLRPTPMARPSSASAFSGISFQMIRWELTGRGSADAMVKTTLPGIACSQGMKLLSWPIRNATSARRQVTLPSELDTAAEWIHGAEC